MQNRSCFLIERYWLKSNPAEHVSWAVINIAARIAINSTTVTTHAGTGIARNVRIIVLMNGSKNSLSFCCRFRISWRPSLYPNGWDPYFEVIRKSCSPILQGFGWSHYASNKGQTISKCGYRTHGYTSNLDENTRLSSAPSFFNPGWGDMEGAVEISWSLSVKFQDTEDRHGEYLKNFKTYKIRYVRNRNRMSWTGITGVFYKERMFCDVFESQILLIVLWTLCFFQLFRPFWTITPKM